MKTLRFLTSAVLLMCWLGQRAGATPIRYTVEFQIGPFPSGNPLGLEGAQVKLTYEIDTAVLTPVFDAPEALAEQATVWPAANTSVALTIAGNSLADGTYADVLADFTGFVFLDEADTGDTVRSRQGPRVVKTGLAR